MSGGDASAAPKSGTLRTTLQGDASLAEAQKLVGYDYRGARATIEVTLDNVRDYCGFVDTTNPLYTNPEYAKRSRWGRPLAPASMVGTAIIAPGLRGVQWIYGGARWRMPGLFGPGDTISQSGTLTGAELKEGKHAQSMIIQKGLTRCMNQRGELVVEAELSCMRIPRGKKSGGLSYGKREVKWTDGELDGFAERLIRQRKAIRGREIMYWDDVAVGQPLPEILCGPLRLTDIALTRGTIAFGIVGGRERDGGYGYMLDHYRRHPADSFVNPETGVTEHPHRGHWEQYMAEEVGMPGIYDIGYQRLGWLWRVVTDWAGDDARLLMLDGRLRRPTIVGDLTLFSGEISRKFVRGGKGVIALKIVARNQLGEETLTGSAEIELLSRHAKGEAEDA